MFCASTPTHRPRAPFAPLIDGNPRTRSAGRGADEVQQVVISPSSPYYLRTSQTAPNFTCAATSNELSGDAATVQLAVATAKTGPTLVAAQAAVAKTIYETCCASDDQLVCSRWRATAKKAGVTVFSDLCALDGSICDDGGNLVQLGLANNFMTCAVGALSLPSFGSLRYAYLSTNELTGDFGEALDAYVDLAELRELSVNGNAKLTGTLSTGTLCALTSSALTLLDVGGTGVSGSLPACLFGAESTLRNLVATGVALEGSLPDAFGEDTPLWQLKLGGTGLSGAIPASLGEAAELKVLALNNNSLAGAAPGFEGAAALQSLDLSFNALTGAIPAALAGHAALYELILSGNKFASLPEGFSALAGEAAPPLATLAVADNQLSGPFPAALPTAYPSLAKLDIAGNAFEGALPDATGAFAELRYLWAGGNRFSGSIPASWNDTGIFQLAPLDAYTTSAWNTFALESNQLTGDLPSFLAQDALLYPVNIALYVRGRVAAGGRGHGLRCHGTMHHVSPLLLFSSRATRSTTAAKTRLTTSMASAP